MGQCLSNKKQLEWEETPLLVRNSRTMSTRAYEVIERGTLEMYRSSFSSGDNSVHRGGSHPDLTCFTK